MFELIIVNLRLYLIGILTIIVIYNVIIYLWNRRYWYYYGSKMQGPFNLPFIGAAWKLLNTREMLVLLTNICKSYKAPVAVWLGSELYFLITDPKHYEILLNSPKSSTKVDVADFFRTAFGDGLLTAAPNKWKRHRKLIQPTFNQKVLNNFVKIFSKHSKILVKDLDDFAGKTYLDVFPMFSKLTMTMACNSLLGYNVLSKEEILNCSIWLNTTLDLVNYRMFKPWLFPDTLWNLTESSMELNKCSRNLNNLIKDIVIQKRNQYKLEQKQLKTEDLNHREADNTKKWKGFLDYAIEILDETGQLTNDEIVEEATTFLAAGTDTTAATNGFFLIMLGLYPEIQDKVYDELYSIFGDSDRPAEAEDLNKMVYLERVIKETMRICPTAPFIARKLDADILLESYKLPKGSSCILALYETHRDPKIWGNPLDFDPDRFLPENVAKRHSYAFIPFGGGPRICIGLKYAMMAMKVALSTVLRTYKVSTNYKNFSDIKFTHSIVLRCSDGFNVAFERRN